MFEHLNSRERAVLARKLHHAAAELLEEGCVLNEIAEQRPSVLAAYNLPRESYHAWYDASREAAMLIMSEVYPRG